MIVNLAEPYQFQQKLLDYRLLTVSRIGTSCSYIGNLGNLESGTFLLDTDGTGKAEAPYEVSDM